MVAIERRPVVRTRKNDRQLAQENEWGAGTVLRDADGDGPTIKIVAFHLDNPVNPSGGYIFPIVEWPVGGKRIAASLTCREWETVKPGGSFTQLLADAKSEYEDLMARKEMHKYRTLRT